MILIFFMGVLGVLFFWKSYYRRHWKDDVAIWLSFSRDFVYEGEQATLMECIENRKRLPLPVLEVGFQQPKELLFRDMENTQVSDFTYKRDVFSLLGRQRITRKLTVNCTKMGYYKTDKVTYAAHSLFFTEKYLLEQQKQVCLYVYARRTDVSDLLLTCERMAGALQCEKRLYEDPFTFRGIREYTLRDPMKTINWKASAKTGSLMVNTFDSTQALRVMIYLDIEDKGIIKRERQIEDGISAAATLTQKLIGKGMEVGIALNAAGPLGTGLILLPSGGGRQLTAVERLLAEYARGGKTVGYDTILHSLPEGSMPVFISQDAARSRQKIEAFLGSSQQGIWVLPIGASERCEVRTRNNLRLCKRKVAGA